jgi:hypothetical protein
MLRLPSLQIIDGAALHDAVDDIFTELVAALNRFISVLAPISETKRPVSCLYPAFPHDHEIRHPLTAIRQLVRNGDNLVALVV